MKINAIYNCFVFLIATSLVSCLSQRTYTEYADGIYEDTTPPKQWVRSDSDKKSHLSDSIEDDQSDFNAFSSVSGFNNAFVPFGGPWSFGLGFSGNGYWGNGPFWNDPWGFGLGWTNWSNMGFWNNGYWGNGPFWNNPWSFGLGWTNWSNMGFWNNGYWGNGLFWNDPWYGVPITLSTVDHSRKVYYGKRNPNNTNRPVFQSRRTNDRPSEMSRQRNFRSPSSMSHSSHASPIRGRSSLRRSGDSYGVSNRTNTRRR